MTRSELCPQPTNEDAAYQWTGDQNLTQGQTQYGYNYHHIDQRTEIHSNQGDSKQSSTDVYAEFTTAATNIQYTSEQAGNYYEAGFDAEYSLDDPCSKFQNMAGQPYGETDHAHYQGDRQSFYQSDVQPEREDHARYVPEGYVHFLLSRWAFSHT